MAKALYAEISRVRYEGGLVFPSKWAFVFSRDTKIEASIFREHFRMMPKAIRNFEFEAISPLRAPDEIAAQIREMIAKGQIKPGDKLPAERDLAQRLNVSRNTLREALRALEQAHLIEMRKGAQGGAFVLYGNTGIITKGMCDLYHLGAITPKDLTNARIWLSKVIVQIVCDTASDDDLDQLNANINATEQAEVQGNFDERAKLNREFHLQLARLTHNAIVESTMQGVMGVMGEFIKQIGPSDNRFVLPSRRRLMKYLRARDADAAIKEMTKMLTRLQDQYLIQWSARQEVMNRSDT